MFWPVSLPIVIIGILGDTHDRADATAAGVRALRDRGAEFFIHTGDVGSETVLDQLAGLAAVFVWGNNDWDRTSLERYATNLGLTCGGDMYRLTLDGKEIAIAHGDDDQAIRGVLAGQTLDYLFTGHTHHPHDKRSGRTRWVNPGALYRARRKTVAALDLATDRLTLLTVNV
jgi:putative phosphoesterase